MWGQSALVLRLRAVRGCILFRSRQAPRFPVTSVPKTSMSTFAKCGVSFTAKDFRTWTGTVLAAKVLQEFKEFDSQAAAKRNVVRAIEHVAGRLGNTKAVCRKCYIHPAVIDAYLEKSLIETVREETERELREELKSLSPEEAAVLALLRKRMQRELREAEAPKRSGRAKRPRPRSRSKTAKSKAMDKAA